MPPLASTHRPWDGVIKGLPKLFCPGHQNRLHDDVRADGDKWVSPKGYVFVYRRTHPLADDHGRVEEHRLVMEAHIGRFLTPDEVVHHKGTQWPIHDKRNRGDNRLENLGLFDNNAAHMRIHKNHIRRNGRWAMKHDACVSCGTTEVPHSGKGLCDACYMVHWRKS